MMATASPPRPSPRASAPSRPERAGAVLLALSVLAAAQAPYLLGEVLKPQGTVFIGHPSPTDANRYMAEMLQGARDGVLFYSNRASTEEHAPAFIFHFYPALGRIASLLGLDFPAMFHLARLAFGVALLLYLFFQSRHFFSHGYERLALMAVVGFSGGFGGVPEANTFRSIAYYPHFAASELFLAIYYLNFAKFSSGGTGWRPAGREEPARAHETGWQPLLPLLLCVAMILLTGIVHPWNLLPMGAVSLAFVGAFWLRGARAADAGRLAGHVVMALAAAAILAVHWRTYATNPVFRAMARQNALPISGWRELASDFGLLWITALGGCFLASRDFKKSPFVFPALWFVVNGLMLAAPFSFQRRLVEGLHIPASILTAHFVFAAGRRAACSIAGRRRRLSERSCVIAATIALLAVTVPANAAFILGLPYLRKGAEFYFFPPKRLIDAMKWVDANMPANSNVVASPAASQLLYRYAMVRVYAAHPVATLEYERKARESEWFYNGNAPDAQRRGFLRDNRIGYIVWGPWEHLSGYSRPSECSWLKPVYLQGDIVIYEAAPLKGPQP